jgi:proteasome lid subunit RPN8/RPN11
LNKLKVCIKKEKLNSLLEFATLKHPFEIILLLRGKIDEEIIFIEEFILPPFGSSGKSFAEFRPQMLPIDYSIVGTAHSHPSGSTNPSITDLHNFYSRVMLITSFPYKRDRVKAYNSKGKKVCLEII